MFVVKNTFVVLQNITGVRMSEERLSNCVVFR
jgi:hypothetical protein